MSDSRKSIQLTTNPIFTTIEKVMTIALKVNAHIFAYPYSTITEHDHGFRTMLWGDFDYFHSDSDLSIEDFEPNCLNVVRSNLHFTNILYRFPEDISNDLLIIGPFLQEEVTESFLRNIITTNNLPTNVFQLVQSYFNAIPFIDEDTVLMTLMTLLDQLIPQKSECKLIYTDYTSSHIPAFTLQYEAVQAYRLKSVEDFIKLQSTFMTSITNGAYHKAKELLPQYMTLCGFQANQSIPDIKKGLYELNTRCQSAMLSDRVHPAYTIRAYQELDQFIKMENRRTKLLQLQDTIIKKYAYLSKNYSFSEYSIDVRKAIAFIDINIDSNISLSDITDYLQKNPQTFSAKFKRETGKTVTNYIRESKIHSAMKLLTSTPLSIHEIASQVGINDFSYFCKLFKTTTEMTPNEYRTNFQAPS